MPHHSAVSPSRANTPRPWNGQRDLSALVAAMEQQLAGTQQAGARADASAWGVPLTAAHGTGTDTAPCPSSATARWLSASPRDAPFDTIQAVRVDDDRQRGQTPPAPPSTNPATVEFSQVRSTTGSHADQRSVDALSPGGIDMSSVDRPRRERTTS